MNKYEGLSKKSPKDAAKVVGDVDRLNYLAHSIREIELAILQTQGRHYHIITYPLKNIRKSSILFYDHCCEIRLTYEYDKIDERIMRLILAHEIGHLVYNIDKLRNPELLKNVVPSNNEEIYAWQFAYHLINEKSLEHEINIQQKKFIYQPGELKKSIAAVLKDETEIYDAVIKGLSTSP
jgi:Zn-dependent peptidase ImmA (M78 family)